MSVVIVGGHDKMSKEYIRVCKKYNCKAKVFTQMETGLKDKIGMPDAVILLTDVVSHKLVLTAKREADKKNITVIRKHKSTVNAVEGLIKHLHFRTERPRSQIQRACTCAEQKHCTDRQAQNF